MPWFKLDDGFFDHPKVVQAGRDARDLWLAAGCYSARELTDGFIPFEVLPLLAAKAGVRNPKGLALRLVEARAQSAHGMFEPREGGYLIHDYLEYNPSRAQVLEEREKTRKRLEGWRAMKREKNARGNAVTNGSSNGSSTASPVPLPRPHVDPTPTASPDRGMTTDGASLSRNSARANGAAVAVDPGPEGPERAPALQWASHEIRVLLGQPESAEEGFWVDLTAAWRQSELDQVEFVRIANAAADTTKRNRAQNPRLYLLSTIKRLTTSKR